MGVSNTPELPVASSGGYQGCENIFQARVFEVVDDVILLFAKGG